MIFKYLKCYYILLLFICTGLLHAQGSYKVVHPEWSYNKSIYEVNLRQYSEAGTFKEFEKHLPRLKEMGVGILWLMPIHPIGEKNRKGTLGSYYSVKDYLAVNPEHGTVEDFRSLVDKIHEHGMYVIIDWVANHTAWDNPWVTEHPEFYTKDSTGNFVPPVADWADVIDLNYDNKELWSYMISALKYWVKDLNIDGYRCDVAGMVPTDFWIEARKELDEIKPVFMLAEWEDPEAHKAFDMTYSWDVHHLMNQIYKGERNASDLVKQLLNEEDKYPDDAFRMRFTSNHDENSWNGTEYERLGDAAETFAALSVAIPGMPLVYTGQEAGLNRRLSFFEKDPIEWKKDKIGNKYSALLNYKAGNKALYNGKRGGEIAFLTPIVSEDVIVFTRQKDEEKILALFNLTGEKKKVKNNFKGMYKNIVTGSVDDLTTSEEVALAPWEYRLLSPAK